MNNINKYILYDKNELYENTNLTEFLYDEFLQTKYIKEAFKIKKKINLNEEYILTKIVNLDELNKDLKRECIREKKDTLKINDNIFEKNNKYSNENSCFIALEKQLNDSLNKIYLKNETKKKELLIKLKLLISVSIYSIPQFKLIELYNIQNHNELMIMNYNYSITKTNITIEKNKIRVLIIMDIFSYINDIENKKIVSSVIMAFDISKNKLKFKYQYNLFISNIFKNLINNEKILKNNNIDLYKYILDILINNIKTKIEKKQLSNENFQKINENEMKKMYPYFLYNFIEDIIKKNKDINKIFESIQKIYSINDIFKNKINTLPIKKKDNIKKDFLIINFNEERESYDNYDCLPILLKIYNENPNFIFVCTQESSSGNLKNISILKKTSHYQHVLNENLEKLNYKRLLKVNANVIGIYDKNVRTRVYYLENILNKNIDNKIEPIFKENKPKLELNTSKNITHNIKYTLKSYGTKISESSGLGKNTGIGIKKPITIYKGSIFIRLILEKENKDYKIIIVNSNLFYKNSSTNNGLKYREKQFSDLVSEFHLIDYYNSGYNIFFSGDLNFRLVPNLPTYFKNNNNGKMSIIKNINHEYVVNKYLENKSTNNLKQINQLYLFLNQNNNFYHELKKSIDILGIHLTYKYYEKQINEELNFYYNNPNKYSYKQIFEINNIPSQTERILFAGKDLDIKPYDFYVHLYPDKSQHKMISLTFNLSYDINKKNIVNKNIVEENNNKKYYFNFTKNKIIEDKKIRKEEKNKLREKTKEKIKIL